MDVASIIAGAATTYPQERFKRVQLSPGSFWSNWRDVVRTVTAPAQLDMLKKTGRYKAFDLQWQDYYGAPMTVWPGTHREQLTVVVATAWVCADLTIHFSCL